MLWQVLFSFCNKNQCCTTVPQSISVMVQQIIVFEMVWFPNPGICMSLLSILVWGEIRRIIALCVTIRSFCLSRRTGVRQEFRQIDLLHYFTGNGCRCCKDYFNYTIPLHSRKFCRGCFTWQIFKINNNNNKCIHICMAKHISYTVTLIMHTCEMM